jgi:uncharacterized protein YciI
MHHLLLYEYVEDIVQRRGPFREAHIERIHAEREAGHVGLAGALGEPPAGGAIVFQDVDRAHVEAFAEADPYMQAGLIRSVRIEAWAQV